MPDLETDLKKTINGLEQCVKNKGFCGPACPYYAEPYGCRTIMEKDAMELLKAQQPRVMTLEEIPEYDGAFLIEYRHEVWPMQWALFRRKLTIAYRFICGDGELGFSISKDLYGKTWRCWTFRPSDAQRKAVKWDE